MSSSPFDLVDVFFLVAMLCVLAFFVWQIPSIDAEEQCRDAGYARFVSWERDGWFRAKNVRCIGLWYGVDGVEVSRG